MSEGGNKAIIVDGNLHILTKRGKYYKVKISDVDKTSLLKSEQVELLLK